MTEIPKEVKIDAKMYCDNLNSYFISTELNNKKLKDTLVTINSTLKCK